MTAQGHTNPNYIQCTSAALALDVHEMLTLHRCCLRCQHRARTALLTASVHRTVTEKGCVPWHRMRLRHQVAPPSALHRHERRELFDGGPTQLMSASRVQTVSHTLTAFLDASRIHLCHHSRRHASQIVFML